MSEGTGGFEVAFCVGPAGVDAGERGLEEVEGGGFGFAEAGVIEGGLEERASFVVFVGSQGVLDEGEGGEVFGGGVVGFFCDREGIAEGVFGLWEGEPSEEGMTEGEEERGSEARLVETPGELEGLLVEVDRGGEVAEVEVGVGHRREPEEAGGGGRVADLFKGGVEVAESVLVSVFGEGRASETGEVLGGEVLVSGEFEVFDDIGSEGIGGGVEEHPFGDPAVHDRSDRRGELRKEDRAKHPVVEAVLDLAGESGGREAFKELFGFEFAEDIGAVVEIGDDLAVFEAPSAIGEFHAFEGFDRGLPEVFTEESGFSEGVLFEEGEALEAFEKEAFDRAGDGGLLGEGGFFLEVALALEGAEEGEEELRVSVGVFDDLGDLCGLFGSECGGGGVGDLEGLIGGQARDIEARDVGEVGEEEAFDLAGGGEKED